MDALSLSLLIIIAAAALALLYASGMLRRPEHVVICAALLALAFVLRGLCMGHVTDDYRTFLSQWVAFYRNNGGFAALGTPVGNYNLPYLYFLCLFSYFNVSDLVLIKALSIAFDVVLAWASMKLVGLYCSSNARRLAAFFLVLFLPTVLLNGAYWGQCDSIYTAFAVLALYLALDGRPPRAWPAWPSASPSAPGGVHNAGLRRAADCEEGEAPALPALPSDLCRADAARGLRRLSPAEHDNALLRPDGHGGRRAQL